MIVKFNKLIGGMSGRLHRDQSYSLQTRRKADGTIETYTRRIAPPAPQGVPDSLMIDCIVRMATLAVRKEMMVEDVEVSPAEMAQALYEDNNQPFIYLSTSKRKLLVKAYLQTLQLILRKTKMCDRLDAKDVLTLYHYYKAKKKSI